MVYYNPHIPWVVFFPIYPKQPVFFKKLGAFSAGLKLARTWKTRLQSVLQVLPSFFVGSIWMFPKIGVPQNGWFIMENPIFQWMIWGYPQIFGNNLFTTKTLATTNHLSLAHSGRGTHEQLTPWTSAEQCDTDVFSDPNLNHVAGIFDRLKKDAHVWQKSPQNHIKPMFLSRPKKMSEI